MRLRPRRDCDGKGWGEADGIAEGSSNSDEDMIWAAHTSSMGMDQSKEIIAPWNLRRLESGLD
jgi:hypothetical protein